MLTLVLVIITAIYVYITWRLLRASRQGLEATVQPQLTVSLTTKVVDEHSEKAVTTIQNAGNMPFTVRHVMVNVECVWARRAGDVSDLYMSGPPAERLLASQEEMSTSYQTPSGRIICYPSSHPYAPCKPVFSALILVEDLHGSVHWFRYDPQSGLRRHPGFPEKRRVFGTSFRRLLRRGGKKLEPFLKKIGDSVSCSWLIKHHNEF